MIITSLYVSNLYVNLLKGVSHGRIETMEELLSTPNTRVYLVKGTSAVNRFRWTDNKVFQKIWEKIISGEGGLVPYSNLYDVISENNYVITSKLEAEYQLYSGDNIYIGKETVIQLHGGLLMRKSLPSVIKNTINKSIQHIIETGLIQHIRDLYLNRMKTRGNYSKKKYKTQRTSLTELADLFMLLLMGTVLSVVIVIIELVYNLLHVRYDKVSV